MELSPELIGGVIIAIYLIADGFEKICKKFGFFQGLWSKIKQRRAGEVGEEIEKKLAPIQKQLGNIDTRLDGIDERLDRIEETNIYQNEQIDLLAVSQKNILRANIMDIYHTYRDTRVFPMSVKEQLDTLYKDYKELKGNSYIDKYYTRMSCWQVLEDEPNP